MRWFSDEEIAFCIEDQQLWLKEENQRLDMAIEESNRRFDLKVLRLIAEARFQGKEAVAVKLESLLGELRCNRKSTH